MNTKRFTGMQAFWFMWLGLLLSFTGSSLTRFGLSVWTFEQTQNPETYSTLLFFATIPLAVGSLFAGPLVDRWNRRTVLIISNIIASLPTLVIMLLYFTEQMAIWHLYVALFINGVANAFILPAFDASIRMLVPQEQLGRASGLSQMVQSLGTIIAPPIAGLMLVQLGLGSIFITDFITVMAAVLALTVIFIPQPIDSTRPPTNSVWQDFLFGLRYIADRPPFVFLMAYLTLIIFAQSFVYALSGPLVLAFSSEESLGFVYGAFGFGGLVGAILVSATGGTPRRMNGILIGAFVMGVAAIVTSLRANAIWIGAGVFLFGLAMTYLIALNRTIYQEKAAPEVLGRVFSFRIVIGVGAQAAGLLLAGFLTANVFEPAMQEGESLTPLFGTLLGIGEGRGSAVLILLVGIVIVGVTLVSAFIPSLRLLEDRLTPPTTEQPTLSEQEVPAPS